MQNVEGQGDQIDGAVQQAVFQQLALRAHQPGEGPQKQQPHGGQHQTAENGGEDGHGKKLVRFFRLALAHGFGDQRAAARAEHETNAAQNHQKGHY